MRFIRLLLVAVPVLCGVYAPAAAAGSWHASLAELAATTGGAPEVALSSATGLARFLRLDRPLTPFAPAPEADLAGREQAAQTFLAAYGELFGLDAASGGLTPGKRTAARGGSVFQRFAQTYRDLPVIAGELSVQTDARGRVVTVAGGLAPRLTLETAPRVSAEAARDLALTATARYDRVDAVLLDAGTPELCVYAPVLLERASAPAQLVWRVTVTAGDVLPLSRLVLVDARSGALVLTFDELPEALEREVYDKDNDATSQSLPGTPEELRRAEGDPASGIDDVDLAYDFLGLTYDFYCAWHGRDSIDGAGLPLRATTRFCHPSYACPYANALWSGSQMIFGEGFAAALDVVAHELTHGVTQNESRLYYFMQSGAINESLSDVWGEAVELNAANPHYTVLPEDRWLLGQRLGAPVRSMADPTRYNDPDAMDSACYWCLDTDNSGVHHNSGVGNKAFALAVDGGTFAGREFAPMGFAKMLPVWYRAATGYLVSGSQYENLADALLSSCQDLQGVNGLDADDLAELTAIIAATHMREQPLACPADQAPICPTGDARDRFFDDLEHGPDNWEVRSSTASSWDVLDSNYAASGSHAMFAASATRPYDTAVAMTADLVVLPGARLHFRHAFALEYGDVGFYDGGVVEYSLDQGESWLDAGSLMVRNGYNGTILPDEGNPLAGRPAFVGYSHGYIATTLNLSPLAGRAVRLRFRYGDDGYVKHRGWWVDDVRIATCPATTVSTWLPLLLE